MFLWSEFKCQTCNNVNVVNWSKESCSSPATR